MSAKITFAGPKRPRRGNSLAMLIMAEVRSVIITDPTTNEQITIELNIEPTPVFNLFVVIFEYEGEEYKLHLFISRGSKRIQSVLEKDKQEIKDHRTVAGFKWVNHDEEHNLFDWVGLRMVDLYKDI